MLKYSNMRKMRRRKGVLWTQEESEVQTKAQERVREKLQRRRGGQRCLLPESGGLSAQEERFEPVDTEVW